MISFVHIASSVLSLALGAIIFFRRKGTQSHRLIGLAYVISMLALNVSALRIYNLTGRFNLFHATAILSLLMVLIGWAQVLLRRRVRNWLYRHYIYMCWSYVALIAAALNEGFVRLHPLTSLVHHLGSWIIIATQAILLALAALLIVRKKSGILARYASSTPL